MKRFHERFALTVDADEARRRFVNRAYNRIFEEYLYNSFSADERYMIERELVSGLGERYWSSNQLSHYITDDFYRVLQSIELLHSSVRDPELDLLVEALLHESELDLGIEWRNGIFTKSGAPILDQELVNEPLGRLSDPAYSAVALPFTKGLQHRLQAHKRPELFYDAVTDMYEALEALAKVVTGRPSKDLSANAEKFIKAIGASEGYKRILKSYIEYANAFRHAVEPGKTRPPLTDREVESFIYLTGLFLRLGLS